MKFCVGKVSVCLETTAMQIEHATPFLLNLADIIWLRVDVIWLYDTNKFIFLYQGYLYFWSVLVRICKSKKSVLGHVIFDLRIGQGRFVT